MVGITLYDRITLIIFTRMDRSHMQSKWIGITLVNCYLKIAWIVYYTTVILDEKKYLRGMINLFKITSI